MVAGLKTLLAMVRNWLSLPSGIWAVMQISTKVRGWGCQYPKTYRASVIVAVMIFCVSSGFWIRGLFHAPAPAPSGLTVTPPAQPKTAAQAAPPPQDLKSDVPPRSRKPVSHPSEVKPGNSATPPTRAMSQPPVVINSAPGGFAVSGGTLYNPSVNNYAPPRRHLTGEQKAALGDPAIKEACNLLNMPVDIQWEPAEEAGTYGREILAAVDKSIVGWRGPMDDSPTPGKGLILGTNDLSNACYLKLKMVFDAQSIVYQTGLLPKPDTTPRTVWYGNKQVQVSQPPQAPRTLIRVGIIE